MILTTNRVKDIESYLKKAVTAKGRAEYTSVDLDWLSSKEVNGRQVCC